MLGMGRIWFKSGGLLLASSVLSSINTLADFQTTDCELSFILSVFSFIYLIQ